MTMPEIDRELDHIRDDIATVAKKVDSVIASIGIVNRLQQEHDQLRSDLFGDKGLSSRVRYTEERIVHHGVWVKIVAAVAGALLVGGAQHMMRVTDEASTLSLHVREATPGGGR